MNLLWITGRRLNEDLASQTELQIANSLSKLGVNITMISPGEVSLEKKGNIDFISLKEKNILGLKTISAGLTIKKAIRRAEIDFKYAIVDWRMVQFCSSFLDKRGISWSIIDRGPPTFDGLLAKLQKLQWKNSWNRANDKTEIAYVVSDMHKLFVSKKTNFQKKFSILPAGVENSWINNSGKIYEDVLRICYSGSLDKNRGLKKLFELSYNLKLLPIKSKIIIIGNGNYRNEIEKFSKVNDNLEYLGNITSRNELERILESCHVGIMPMPNKEIWNISSSIKLPEYLSKGMLIIGVNHPGNCDGIGPFYQLSDLDWPVESISKLTTIIMNGNWKEYSQRAVEKSKMMTWDKTAKTILDSITNNYRTID